MLKVSMENANLPPVNNMASTPPSSKLPGKNIFQKLPLSYTLSLGFLALTVLVLPVLAVTAAKKTALDSKGFQPTTPIKIEEASIDRPITPFVERCQALSFITFENPCGIDKIVTISERQPQTISKNAASAKNADIAAQKQGARADIALPPTDEKIERVDIQTPPTGGFVPDKEQARKYTSVRFTCSDGYSETYSKKACVDESSLRAYATNVCAKHDICGKSCKTGLKAQTLSNPCKGGKTAPTPQPRVQTDKKAVIYGDPAGGGNGVVREITVANATNPTDPGLAPEKVPGDKGLIAEPGSMYSTISFTCQDDFKTTYSVKSCVAGSELIAYATKVCASHSLCANTPVCKNGVRSSVPSVPCKPTPTKEIYKGGERVRTDAKPLGFVASDQMYKAISFVCEDGSNQSYTAQSCSTRAELFAQAEKICKLDSPCPITSVTPTPVCKSGVNSFTAGEFCGINKTTLTVEGRPREGQTDMVVTGILSATYTCHGSNKTFTASTGACATQDELTAIAKKACDQIKSCPTIAPEPRIKTTETIQTLQAPVSEDSQQPTSDMKPQVETQILPVESQTLPGKVVTRNQVPYFITTSPLPNGSLGQSYTASIVAADKDAKDMLTLSLDTLPSGLTKSCTQTQTGSRASCTITGTPRTAGTFTIVAAVTDGKGGVAKSKFVLNITGRKRVITPLPYQTR